MKHILLILALLAAPFLKAQTVTDPFTGSPGIIGAPNWTTSVCSGYSTLSQNSGIASPTTAATQGIIQYSGSAFASNQSSQVLVPASGHTFSGTTGPSINLDTSCTGILWILNAQQIILLSNGGFGGTIGGAVCPVVNAGDSPQLYRSGNDIHCKNGATDVNAGTEFGQTGGNPGLMVDARTFLTDALSTFTATGALLPFAADPVASPVAGFYATSQTVTLTCATPSSTILYGINASPTLTYTTPLSVTSTQTINTKCTATGFSDSPIAVFGYHIGGGNLSKITLYPPADGYHITTNTGTVQLVPVCSYSNGFVDDDCATSGYTLTWGSSDDTVFTVNSSTGLATGSGPGADFVSASVYATYNGFEGDHIVFMDSSVPTQLTSRPEGAYSDIRQGATVLVGAIDSSGGNTVSGPSVSNFAAYTTSNAAVATVDNVGRVTGVSAGSATITATYYGLTVGRSITVSNPTVTSPTVYYVRINGGDRTQCTGLSNVDYPGSGTGVACAVNNPMYCFTDESSSSTYTGLVQTGDICQIQNNPNRYRMGTKASGVAWITNDGNFISPPSGTTAHHTTIRGENFGSCTSPRFGPGNRAQVWAYHVGWLFDLRGVQNFDMQCVDDDTVQDCNPGINDPDMSFQCPAGGGTQYGFMTNNFTANANITDARFNGFQTAQVGTPGLNLILTRVQSEGSYLAGWNYDNPFGFTGNRTDGITQSYTDTSFSGFTEDLPHSISAASIDGSGNLNVTFSSVLNYVPGTMLVLSGMTPSQFNGTFPVTAVTFNQQTTTITGGSCDLIASSQGSVGQCTMTTSSAPAFALGAFIKCTGTTSTNTTAGFFNSTWEVWNVSGSTFRVNASVYTRPGFPITPVTFSAGGTCSTANTLVATLTGSASTASVLGLASHVYNYHRALDQGDGAVGNGDCDGSGIETIGDTVIDHANVFDCTQDGIDQLHASAHISSVTNSTAVNTSGAGFKFGNASIITFQNNLAVTPCAWTMAFNPALPPEWNQYPALPCRAGIGIGIETRIWSKINISNNTQTTNFGAGMSVQCDDSNFCNKLSTTLFPAIWQNNLFQGFSDTNDPQCSSGCSYLKPYDLYINNNYTVQSFNLINNMGYHTNGGPAGASNNWAAANSFVTAIPDITSFGSESNTLTWNAQITSGSPAAGFGVHNLYTPTNDLAGLTRPNPPSAGAYDIGAPTLVSMVVGNVTVAISGTATSTCVATYSDSSTGVCFSPVWSSATPSVATVNSSTGLVTGVSAGTSAITAFISPITSSPGTATVTSSPAGLLTIRGNVVARGNITFQ